ncbi:MAG: hypothetical protein DRG30_07665 [Epsilonproteobacteria bacterium]|nr:MAG: hypothetical protein DRG30_07665 [Campylobacterota bacterium]
MSHEQTITCVTWSHLQHCKPPFIRYEGCHKKLISICDIYPTDQDMIAGLAGIDTIAIRGNIVFRAEGKMGGVSISNIDECKVMKVIPFEEYWISSIYIVHNTLVAYNVTDKTSRVYNLDSLFPEYKVKVESKSATPPKEKEIGHPSYLIKDSLQCCRCDHVAQMMICSCDTVTPTNSISLNCKLLMKDARNSSR